MNPAMRASAVAGLVGALLMFLGDMLFYGQWGSGRDALTRSFELASGMPAERLMLGGLVAMPAGAAYLLGLFHIHHRLKHQHWRAGLGILTGMAAILVTALATHVAWGAFALAARSGSDEAARLIGHYLSFHFRIAQVIAVPTTIGFTLLVLFGRTSWPKWSVAFNPGLLYVLLATGSWIPGPFGAALVGGAFNLAFATFFLMSALAPHLSRTTSAIQISSD